MDRPKTITFNGHKYGLNGKYYRLYNYGKRDVPTTLHRAIWVEKNGPIPPGHHIHHKDGDTFNNKIENLECISASEHLSEHGFQNPWSGSPENIAQLASINHLAKAWHKTEEGRKHHVSNGHKAWENRVLHRNTCLTCKEDFETPFPTRAKYCSNNCKCKAQPKRQEERVCTICGTKFNCFPYGPTKTCSKACSNVFSVQQRREKNGGKY